MIRDNALTYSLTQAVTAVGSTDSTNAIDQLAPGDAYTGLFLDMQVVQAFTSGGSATLTVNLITDSSSAFATAPATYTLATAIPVASLTAGTVLFKGQLPQGMKRYRKLVYVIGTAVMTAGTITSFETPDIQTNRQN